MMASVRQPCLFVCFALTDKAVRVFARGLKALLEEFLEVHVAWTV